DVLARPQRLDRHGGVRGRDGQVDYDLHVVEPEHLRHTAGALDPVLRGRGRRALLVEVGHGRHAQVGEAGQVAQILAADVAGAYDGDADRSAAHPRFPLSAPSSRPATNARLLPSASSRSVAQASNSTTRSACGAAARTSATGIRPVPTATFGSPLTSGPSLTWMATTRSPRPRSTVGTSAPPTAAQ